MDITLYGRRFQKVRRSILNRALERIPMIQPSMNIWGIHMAVRQKNRSRFQWQRAIEDKPMKKQKRAAEKNQYALR